MRIQHYTAHGENMVVEDKARGDRGDSERDVILIFRGGTVFTLETVDVEHLERMLRFVRRQAERDNEALRKREKERP